MIIYANEVLILNRKGTNGCPTDWITANIPSKDASISYHEFANTSNTWCLKVMSLMEGKEDDCVLEGANRITFGQNRHDFAVAVIDVFNHNVGKYLKYLLSH